VAIAIAAGPDGRLYVADRWGVPRRVYTARGALAGLLGRCGSGPGTLEAPYAIATAPSRVYVSDMARMRSCNTGSTAVRGRAPAKHLRRPDVACHGLPFQARGRRAQRKLVIYEQGAGLRTLDVGRGGIGAIAFGPATACNVKFDRDPHRRLHRVRSLSR